MIVKTIAGDACRGAALMYSTRVALNGAVMALRKLRAQSRKHRSRVKTGNKREQQERTTTTVPQLRRLLIGNGALRWALFGSILKLSLQRERPRVANMVCRVVCDHCTGSAC